MSLAPGAPRPVFDQIVAPPPLIVIVVVDAPGRTTDTTLVERVRKLHGSLTRTFRNRPWCRNKREPALVPAYVSLLKPTWWHKQCHARPGLTRTPGA